VLCVSGQQDIDFLDLPGGSACKVIRKVPDFLLDIVVQRPKRTSNIFKFVLAEIPLEQHLHRKFAAFPSSTHGWLS